MTISPFNARSLTLSVLLGLPSSHLTTPALMRLAELFDIAPGTLRTALSRMVAAGELRAMDGGYRLCGRLLDRKSAQDIGRTPPPSSWDGGWWIVAVTAPARGITQRREFRTNMTNARLGELRADTWLRPANTAQPVGTGDAIVLRGTMSGRDPHDLADQLWGLDGVAARSRELDARLGDTARRLGIDGESALARSMLVAAEVVRFLRSEPYLPPALAGPDWPIDDLRSNYSDFDLAFGRELRRALYR